MESDSIRPSGANTVVDIWINGRLRSICVEAEAIGAFVGFEQAAGMSEDDRCDFVRTHLALVVTAAKTRLRDTNPASNEIIIGPGQLAKTEGGGGDRRATDRRKGDRRKGDRPIAHPDRRRGDRRTGQRRTRPPKSDS